MFSDASPALDADRLSPPPIVNGRAKLTTLRRQRTFLTALADAGMLLQACQRAKVSRNTVFEWRRDPAFAALFQEAIDHAIETFAREAVRRGRDGWLEPVYQGGKKVGSIRKYSDRLLELVLKAKLPEYRQASVRHEVTGAGGGPIVVTNVIEGYSDAELAEVNRMLESRGIKVLPDVIDVTPK